MRDIRFRRSLFLLWSLLLTGRAVFAAPSVTSLEGQTLEPHTGRALAGATVDVEGHVSLTDSQGRFSFSDLPIGHHLVVVSAQGYERVEIPFELTAGANTLPPIALTAEAVHSLDKFVLEEKKNGAAAQFNDKAGTEALTEVVSAAELKNPNSQTASDLLKNTSGVAVNKGADGSSKISVRGLDQRLLRITVDGQRQGGTGNALDNIPPEIVQSLEVTKAFTPDMEADAVGGVINVNTGGTVLKSGYEQGRHQLTYNGLESRPGTRNSLTVGKPFSLFSSKPDASVLITGSFDDQYKVRERLSTLREWPSASNLPVNSPFAGIPVLTLPLIESTLEHRQRTGLVINSDARLGATTLFFRSNFNRDWAKRNRNYDDTNPASGTAIDVTPTSGTFSGVAQSRRNQAQISQRDAANFSLGGKTLFGRTEIDATLGLALTDEREPDTVETVFVSDHLFRMTYDLRPNAFVPVYTQVDETVPGDTTSINNPARYQFNYLTVSHVETRDEEASAKVNVKLNLDDPGKSGDYLKFGGKAQQRHRKANTDRDVYDPGVQSRDMIGLEATPTVAMETVGYRFGPVPSADAVAATLTATPAPFTKNIDESRINSNTGDYDVTETVWALYGMGKVKFDAWTLLGGIRVEGTRITAKANQMVFDSTGKLQGFNRAGSENSYVQPLPGLHLRYDPEPGLLYRASVTRSLARPNYADVAPFRTLSFIDHRSRIGTPDLKPYQSTNVDLSVDKYIEKTGLFSLALFYKKIDHFIADEQYTTTVGDLGQFIEFKRVNGDTALAMGVEANWQSPTWDLPSGIGKGSFGANYSYTHGEAHYPTRPGETFPLPDQVNYQGSLNAHLDHGGFSTDASVRYRSKWWEDLIAPGFDNYLKGAWDAEISGSYKLNKAIRVTAGVNNLLNLPTRHYAGTLSRMNDYQRNGIDFTAGVQWKL